MFYFSEEHHSWVTKKGTVAGSLNEGAATEPILNAAHLIALCKKNGSGVQEAFGKHPPALWQKSFSLPVSL